jgi:hypothetical protein
VGKHRLYYILKTGESDIKFYIPSFPGDNNQTL